MGFNFGTFAGGFGGGFASGIQIGKTLREVKQEQELQDLRAKGMAEARAAAANGLITGGPQQVAAPQTNAQQTSAPQTGAPQQTQAPATAPQDSAPQQAATAGITGTLPQGTSDQQPQGQPASLPYVVNGQTYANKEDAITAAQKLVTPEMQYKSWIKNGMPELQNKMVEMGQFDAANKLGEWAKQEQNKEYAKTYYQTRDALTAGDYEKAMQGFADMHKQLNDGYTVVGKPQPVKDDQGNITAYSMKMRDDKTGKEFDQTETPETMNSRGLAYFNPIGKFSLDYQAQQAADKERADFAKQKALKQMDYNQQDKMAATNQNNSLEKITIEKQLEDANASNKIKREVGAKVQALRDAGYSDDFINQALPAILGVGDYKKATSPEEARRLAFSDRMKADPMFTRKPAAEQQKIIDQDMSLIYGGIKPSQVPTAAGGLPPSQSQPQKKGVPVYDAKSGTIVYR